MVESAADSLQIAHAAFVGSIYSCIPDESFWPDRAVILRPEKYDITRRVIGHVGFGSGIHRRVGQLLARLEGECVLPALACKVASVEVTDRLGATTTACAHWRAYRYVATRLTASTSRLCHGISQ